jgi:hypothetical protein
MSYYDKNGIPMSLMDWAHKFEDVEYKRVARYQNLFVLVSTVWLGLDHNFTGGTPLIFESMAFSRFGASIDCQRYSTLDEALKGHKAMVKKYWWRIDIIFRRR